jgi:hypothetical protein
VANYGVIQSRFWDDPKVRAWDNDPRMLALYLLSCRHGSSSGIFVLPLSYATEDLCWDMPRLTLAMTILERDGFLLYDRATRVAFMPSYLRNNPLQNENQIKGAVKHVCTLPDTPLIAALIESARNCSEQWTIGLGEALMEQFQNPSETLSKPFRGYAQDSVLDSVPGSDPVPALGRGSAEGGQGELDGLTPPPDDKPTTADADFAEWRAAFGPNLHQRSRDNWKEARKEWDALRKRKVPAADILLVTKYLLATDTKLASGEFRQAAARWLKAGHFDDADTVAAARKWKENPNKPMKGGNALVYQPTGLYD